MKRIGLLVLAVGFRAGPAADAAQIPSPEAELSGFSPGTGVHAVTP